MNSKYLPWIVLSTSIVVTIFTAFVFLEDHNHSEQILFELFSEKITIQIQDKLKTHEQVLMGFQGLHSTSEIVEDSEFRNFYNIQKIEQRFEDNQGIGFIEYVDDENRKNEINQTWKEMGLESQIFPEGERSEYFPVVLLQPDDFRNKRALGYDVYSEQIRRDAIDHSLQTGDTTITGKITLVQETGENIQNGFLIILPVNYFHDEDSPKYGELLGFVYSVFRMDDFILGTIGHEFFDDVEIKIYDDSISDKNLFFDSNTIFTSDVEPKFSKLIDVYFGGKTWKIQFQGVHSSYETTHIFTTIFLIGFSMSIILFFTSYLFSKNTQLNKSIAEKEKIAMLGELTSRLAHDIRNPLSTINLAKELLDKKTTDEKNKELLNMMDKGISRISHQVNDVLDFVRTKSVTLNPESIKTVMDSAITNSKIPQNIKVIKSFSNSIILCDFIQLETAFTNILINAVQSISGMGKITINMIEENDFLKIDIINSGPEIPEDDLKNIFEPLFTTKQKGTGLGLVSCKNIIESHGGTILVKNNPTTFSIRLPFSK